MFGLHQEFVHNIFTVKSFWQAMTVPLHTVLLDPQMVTLANRIYKTLIILAGIPLVGRSFHEGPWTDWGPNIKLLWSGFTCWAVEAVHLP